jgi:myo-inositol-1(or 4)-monophosphatase
MTETPTPGTGPGRIDPARLAEFEALAAEFARIAGAEIVAARSRAVAVRYKDLAGAPGESGGDAPLWRDPVTQVDHDVEVLMRARLAERFPDHDVIGEEIETERPGTTGEGTDFLWAIDPIDGTTNFVNGFPLYAASIGLLHRGAPVVGAIWCSATHALGPGVYHARAGGPLAFDGQPFRRFAAEGVRRRLAGIAGRSDAGDYEPRWTGSAAIECAFVAAGLMAAARFRHTNIWDVAGGVALVRSAGGEVLERQGEADWRPFADFGPEPWAWKGGLILGGSEGAAGALV